MGAFYTKALDAYEKQDYSQYFKTLKQGASKKDWDCVGLMGVSCIEQVGGFKKDNELGLFMLESAVNAYHIPSIHVLGIYYYKGLHEVPRDRKKGLSLIRRSALMGYSPAQYELNGVYCASLKFKRAGAWAIVAMQFGNEKAKQFCEGAAPFKQSTVDLANTIIKCIKDCVSQELTTQEALKIITYYENHEF
ncbi:sel1 repeat family protein [Aquimarina longa]|uniref:sel1 repeat family protein n=1 Tax=Aquimarina longa TaxID=1080221 RepID=UPI00078201FA|nr:sel1 repeat family protein [Aquimarina longa]